MDILKMIRELEKETRELRRLASHPDTSYELSIKLRNEQEKKWKQLQVLKRMVNCNGIH